MASSTLSPDGKKDVFVHKIIIIIFYALRKHIMPHTRRIAEKTDRKKKCCRVVIIILLCYQTRLMICIVCKSLFLSSHSECGVLVGSRLSANGVGTITVMCDVRHVGIEPRSCAACKFSDNSIL